MATALRIDHDSPARTKRRRKDTKPSDIAIANALSLLGRRYVERPEWAAIYDAPPADGCPCATCHALRTKAFKCAVCGSDDAPVVHACTCVANWQADIDNEKRNIAECERRGVTSYITRSGCTNSIAFSEQRLGRLLTHRPTDRCTTKEESFDDCLHLYRECGVCGTLDAPNGQPMDKYIVDPWEIIRDLRAALTDISGAR